MAFPKLLQKLFQNNGAGDKLRSEILPDMNYLPTNGGTVSGNITLNGNLLGIIKADKNGSLALSGGNELSNGFAGSAILWLGGGNDSSGFKGPGVFSRQASKGTWGQPGFSSHALEGKPDGSLTWDGKPVLCGESGGFPVGFLALYAGSNVPDGWFRCDGSTVANMATNYPKLYAVLGKNVLPNSSGMCLQGAVSDIGTNVSAGLPNITGSFQTLYPGTPITGAFYESSGTSNGDGGNGSTKGVTLDASRSNGIYGRSSTVQPPAIKVAVLIKHD